MVSPRPKAWKQARNTGIVMPLAAVATMALLAMAGLALDTGVAFKNHRESQLATDAAALAGAHELFRGNSRAEAISAARAAAAANGYAHGSDGVTVNINIPPSRGFYATNDLSVEAIIDRPTPTSFLAVLNIVELDVGTRAVANGAVAGGSACIYVLDPSLEGSFEVSSDSILDADCGIQVNSTDNRASKVESGACVRATFVGITGGHTTGQVCDALGGPAYECSQADQCPTNGVPPMPDPLASFPDPPVDYSHCDYSGNPKEAGGPWERYLVDGGSHTLHPGTYCGGLDIVGDAQVNLMPGTYVMRGGGFFVSGGDTEVTGSEITIYNTCSSPCVGNETDQERFSPIEITSSSEVDLSAPTSGDMEGMLLMQDRNGPTSQDPGAYPSNRIDSSVTARLQGMMYFPTQHFKFHSSSDGLPADYELIVAKTFEVSSNSSIVVDNDFDDLASKVSPLKRVTLVE